MFSPSGVRGPGPAAWSNRVGESVRSMVGLYRLYWIPFTFRMLLIHIVKRDQMHHVLWYHILHIRNCIISIEAHHVAVHQPSVRPGVRRPSKMRKAQRPSRCRAWKTEVDGHKLRLHQGSFAKPMKQHDQPLISLGLAKKSNSKSASKP